MARIKVTGRSTRRGPVQKLRKRGLKREDTVNNFRVYQEVMT